MPSDVGDEMPSPQHEAIAQGVQSTRSLFVYKIDTERKPRIHNIQHLAFRLCERIGMPFFIHIPLL